MEKELINLYDNAIKKGRDDLIVHIKLRLRSDFPRAANRLFGAKQVDAVDKHVELHSVLPLYGSWSSRP